ncbi:MAG: kinase/pyrophosphorylase [bacterium]|nr:MAG: kinase/pyrophosphorylase [bacterium]
MHKVFVVSDGTGGTAERALQAALTQFQGLDLSIDLRSSVRTHEQIEQIVQEASNAGAFIVHTLVSNEMREFMLHQGRIYNIETIDLMGPLLSRLSQQFTVTPAQKPGLFRQLNEDYFRRIESMEFALRHDDGQRIEEISRAEIVLVGVSRTFKTPLSIFLSFKQWYVANVPIVLEIEPPAILSEIEQSKIFGLTMDSRRLANLRQARQEYLGGASGRYADLDYVRREVVFALKFFEKHPHWPVVNVTGKPIEEIAAEIIALTRQGKNTD